jgi:hypothetical protein
VAIARQPFPERLNPVLPLEASWPILSRDMLKKYETAAGL